MDQTMDKITYILPADNTLHTVAVVVIGLALLFFAGWGLWLLVQKRGLLDRLRPEKQVQALDDFERSLLHLQREQKILASDLADLRRKHDGLIEILLAFIEDLETSRHRLELLQGDPAEVKGAMSFYDSKLASLLGALGDQGQADLLASEAGFLRAEIGATERYTGVVLNRIIAVRGTIAHTQLKIRKSGYVGLLQHMNQTLQSCENRLYQLNEPGMVRLYDRRREVLLPAGGE